MQTVPHESAKVATSLTVEQLQKRIASCTRIIEASDFQKITILVTGKMPLSESNRLWCDQSEILPFDSDREEIPYKIWIEFIYKLRDHYQAQLQKCIS